MGLFGWSLPPGCGTLPGEETGASEITQLVTRKPDDVLGVFWDEDGNLIESFTYTVPADPECGIPEYHEQDCGAVGVHPWDDELTDDENMRRAAARYDAIKADPTELEKFARGILDVFKE